MNAKAIGLYHAGLIDDASPNQVLRQSTNETARPKLFLGHSAGPRDPRLLPYYLLVYFKYQQVVFLQISKLYAWYPTSLTVSTTHAKAAAAFN